MRSEVHRTIEERLEQIESDVCQIKTMFIKFLSAANDASPKEEPLLNVKDVCSFLKVDSNAIYNACNKREIPFIKIGKSYKFRKEDILKWIDKGQDKKLINVDDYVEKYLQKHTLRG